MKNRKISIEKVIMIFLIVIIICMFFVIMNMKNKNIEGQKIAKEQLGEATTDNSYISMSTHMSALDAKQQEINDIQNTSGQATVTADKILKNYTAYKNGQLITGTMINNGAVNHTLNAGKNYTIPAGYHDGNGKVIANSLASQTSATATASDITLGKTAWVNGELITGISNNSNNGVQNVSLLASYSGERKNNQFSKTLKSGKHYIIMTGCYMYGGNLSNCTYSITGADSITEVDNGIFLIELLSEKNVTFNINISVSEYNSNYEKCYIWDIY